MGQRHEGALLDQDSNLYHSDQDWEFSGPDGAGNVPATFGSLAIDTSHRQQSLQQAHRVHR
jgi:hypothetical protein